MRYLAFVCDYDGTLARRGRVAKETLEALEKVRASGRKLILVTGRQLIDLATVFPGLDVFSRVVVENGAVLYRPSTREEKVLCDPPPQPFIEALRQRQVSPLVVGHAIVATSEPYETVVLDVIRDLGLELHVIFNKGSVMVLPAGVNKASGMAMALQDLGLSPHNAVGVGDAENDHAFLGVCECSVAVAGALPMLKERADLVMKGDDGDGVVELCEAILRHDLREWEPALRRHEIPIGTRANGEPWGINPYGENVLIAGPSGSGKSNLALGVLERLVEREYQFCVLDPEGDYETFQPAAALGNKEGAPSVDEVLRVLENPKQNVVVNLVGLPLAERPAFFTGLVPRLQELRMRTGRPHRLIVDETHHLLPRSWDASSLGLLQGLHSMIYITVQPESVAPAVLSSVDAVIVVGVSPEATMARFREALGDRGPAMKSVTLDSGEVLVWPRRVREGPFIIRTVPTQMERRRHRRKYAEGELPPERSFYFLGPQGKLNLRSQNLMLFIQVGEGVDDETWMHHLGRGDYSRWIRESLKDDMLADEVAEIEHEQGVSARESRARLKSAIERHYTLPVTPE